MDNNQPQNLTKETVIKRFLIILVGSFLGFVILVVLQYGNIPKGFLREIVPIVVIFVPMMIICAIAGYKYRASVTNWGNKLWYFFLILGILMAIVNLVLIFIEGGNLNYYVGFGVGLMFIIYSIYKIKKNP